MPYIYIILIATILGVSGGAAYGLSEDASEPIPEPPAAVAEPVTQKVDTPVVPTESLTETAPETRTSSHTMAVESAVEQSVPLTPEAPTQTQATSIPTVPFFSQFRDISSPKWQKIGCGVTSLAMLIELYEPGRVTVNTLLNQGIAEGAYLNNAGWIHSGLVRLAQDYGLTGKTHDLSSVSSNTAFAEFKDALTQGPVIASVHYTFDPQNPIPHLVVINGIDGDTVYYNDPSEGAGGGTISVAQFRSSWKKRWIEIHPTT